VNEAQFPAASGAEVEEEEEEEIYQQTGSTNCRLSYCLFLKEDRLRKKESKK
jgi:hypothetical protein